MNHPLELKIRQMHAALKSVRSSDLTQIRVKAGHIDDCEYCEIDYSGGANEVELANIVTLLIANIGSLRDHLKHWCSDRGVPFEGDKLINESLACALIHDLWNTDKHSKLTKPPRSGRRPRIVNLEKGLRMSTGNTAGSSCVFSIDPFSGRFETSTFGGGEVFINLSGRIIDENGAMLGEFSEVAEEAVRAWEKCLKQAGVIT